MQMFHTPAWNLGSWTSPSPRGGEVLPGSDLLQQQHQRTRSSKGRLMVNSWRISQPVGQTTSSPKFFMELLPACPFRPYIILPVHKINVGHLDCFPQLSLAWCCSWNRPISDQTSHFPLLVPIGSQHGTAVFCMELLPACPFGPQFLKNLGNEYSPHALIFIWFATQECFATLATLEHPPCLQPPPQPELPVEDSILGDGDIRPPPPPAPAGGGASNSTSMRSLTDS